jgi:hypothetical protein
LPPTKSAVRQTPQKLRGFTFASIGEIMSNVRPPAEYLCRNARHGRARLLVHSVASLGPMIFGYPILSPGLSAGPAAIAVQMCGRISTGTGNQLESQIKVYETNRS